MGAEQHVQLATEAKFELFQLKHTEQLENTS